MADWIKFTNDVLMEHDLTIKILIIWNTLITFSLIMAFFSWIRRKPR
jgi:hypothetical protein